MADPLRTLVAAGDTEIAGGLTRTLLAARERALEAATSGIAVADARHPDMRLVYVNRAFARLFGWERTELVGRSPAVLAGEATGIEARRDLAAAMREGRDHEATILTYRRDG